MLVHTQKVVAQKQKVNRHMLKDVALLHREITHMQKGRVQKLLEITPMPRVQQKKFIYLKMLAPEAHLLVNILIPWQRD